MIAQSIKKSLVERFGKDAKDSGSTEVQVAILTERIKDLTPHFSANKKDYHSKRGMMKLIGKRRRLLRYLAGKNNDRYLSLIKELGIRK